MHGRTLERRWRDSINEGRMALGAAPIGSLPAGVRRDPRDCTQHRAMRDLDLGRFEVWSDQLVVDNEFTALILAQAWGTEVVTTKHGTGPILPAIQQEAIAEFDKRLGSKLKHLAAV